MPDTALYQRGASRQFELFLARLTHARQYIANWKHCLIALNAFDLFRDAVTK
jgi:hypothetical protein